MASEKVICKVDQGGKWRGLLQSRGNNSAEDGAPTGSQCGGEEE